MKEPTFEDYRRIQKSRTVTDKIRQIRRTLNWAIKTFDKEDTSYGTWYFFTRSQSSVTKRLADFDPNTNKKTFPTLREKLLPELLNIYKSWGMLEPGKHDTLLQQINSPDRENWYIAFIVIQRIQPHKPKKK